LVQQELKHIYTLSDQKITIKDIKYDRCKYV
jgi:hypothetical protein